ncbi:lysophospholipid acyltransferase family protein [Cytophagaceae bacterium YF14B1]|uniref:Lysophospholipid acyltransferase family protein n=1 Tax=Xanthocytophaga flava TaxID=3048013 RepID=A0AAE3U619_9BACT|nr:lysophospholipid acyltransferase family protein [Xanthocytophaga flavus]MDJ1481409.1 lysophospholipid acyltransferase family protein [Xanthocytophaga flavus]
MRRLYSFWCYFWFLGLFLLLFPFFWLFLQREKWHPKAHYLNRLWGQLFFPLCGISVDIENRATLSHNQAYVFCSNHFSYLDIAVMGVVLPHYYAFIGKSQITKVPLFGYMFRKLHIPVNRESKLERYRIVQKSVHFLQHNRSIVIFPEGGIKSKQPPRMAPFKDGAFRMAIDTQVPIVPITFPYNWQILPDDGKLLFLRKGIKVIIHEPIPTTGMTVDDMESLKDQTFTVIESELEKYFTSLKKEKQVK